MEFSFDTIISPVIFSSQVITCRLRLTLFRWTLSSLASLYKEYSLSLGSDYLQAAMARLLHVKKTHWLIIESGSLRELQPIQFGLDIEDLDLDAGTTRSKYLSIYFDKIFYQ